MTQSYSLPRTTTGDYGDYKECACSNQLGKDNCYVRRARLGVCGKLVQDLVLAAAAEGAERKPWQAHSGPPVPPLRIVTMLFQERLK